MFQSIDQDETLLIATQNFVIVKFFYISTPEAFSLGLGTKL